MSNYAITVELQAVQSSSNDFDVAVLEAKLSEVEGKSFL